MLRGHHRFGFSCALDAVGREVGEV